MREDYTVLGPVVCAGALGVGGAEVPAWQQALGALVLTHEAFHLRHWRFRRNEGKVECQAETRVVVSSTRRPPRVWNEVPESHLGIVQPGADELRPFTPIRP